MQRPKSRLSVVVPVYNEEESLPVFIPKLFDTLKKNNGLDFEIITVDDGSNDKSLSLLSHLKNKKLIKKLVKNDVNQGYGASLRRGIDASRYENILIIDSDGTYPLQEIPKFISNMKRYSMVIGARIKQGVEIPLERRIPKKIMLFIARLLTGNNIVDINSGMRVFSKKIAYKYWHLYPDRWSMSSTLTLCFHLNGHSVLYLPIGYEKRIGQSKIRPTDFFYFIGLIIRLVVYFKPLKFFFGPGIISTFVGLSWIIYTLITEKNVTDTGLIIFITGLQTTFFGLVADLIVKTREYNEKK